MIRSARLALLCLAPALAAPADAGWPRHCHRTRPRLSTCAAGRVDNAWGGPPRRTAPGPGLASRALPAPPSAYASPQGAYVAPQGGPQAHQDFLGWLSGVRASRGLGAVYLDPGLAADAAANSGRGFGHAYRGRGRGQVVGWGSLEAVSAAWLASPAHYAILMDPGVTAVGIGVNGPVWTVNVN